MNFLLVIDRLVLAAVFAAAGVGKLRDREGSRKSIIEFGAPKFLAGPVAFLLPLAELLCAVALLPAASAAWGAAGVLAMLVVFSAAMTLNLARGRRPACHCFGQLHSAPIGPGTLVRNGVLSAMAALVLWQGARNPRMGEVWISLNQYPATVPVLVVAVLALLVSQFWMLLTLLKQNGRLMLRLETVEARLKIDRTGADKGLPVGEAAPAFRLRGLNGSAATLENLAEEGKPLLLVFVEPGCGPCEALMPDIAQWQQQYGELVKVALISQGTRQANASLAAKHQLAHVLLQEVRETAEEYRVGGTPAAVLVKDGKIASPLASGADAIRSLAVRSTLPPGAGIGEMLPSYTLPELGGGAVDLSRLSGRRRLLLLWDPECGYCKAVTEDVKDWERKRREEDPELLIITAGTPEAVRALGFRSRVLLDPHFAAGTLLKARGTPSAVILGEDGRIASEVGAGIVGVFELLGAVPYVPTDETVVEEMLSLAGTGKTDTVYDLGCGDGRIVITAAKKYGARGVGVDVNPERIREARARAKKARVEKRVRFEERDVLNADISEATVVTLYLLPGFLQALLPKLRTELTPGTRVVSHDFAIDGWEPDREARLDRSTLYLYTVPEKP